MKTLRVLAFAAAAMAASSTWASAQEAFTTADVNMRAGPGSRYPVVTTIPEDREVYIHGCLSDWDWCDVSWRRNRGWVFSENLEAFYRSRRIPIYEYRTYIDLPIVSFGFGYWDRYYRNRPWYDDWDHWHVRLRDRDRDHRDRDRNRGDWNNNDDAWDQTDRLERRERRQNDDVVQDRQRRRDSNRDMCSGPNPDPSCSEDDAMSR